MSGRPKYKLKTTKVEKSVVEAYKKLERSVVESYFAVENAFVGAYQKIEDKFVDTFLEEMKDEEAPSNSPQGGGLKIMFEHQKLIIKRTININQLK